MDEVLSGVVKFFNFKQGFGFITRDGVDYFVHVTNIQDSDQILEGEEVEFRPVESHKGWQAIEVVRKHPPQLDVEEGTVKFFSEEKGYGFIERPGKADVFAHLSDIVDEDHRLLVKGQVVSFQVRAGREGRDRAYKISVVQDV